MPAPGPRPRAKSASRSKTSRKKPPARPTKLTSKPATKRASAKRQVRNGLVATDEDDA